MPKTKKNIKKKYSASYRIDYDLYEKCQEKCHRESIAKRERITLSGMVEELLREWVAKK